MTTVLVSTLLFKNPTTLPVKCVGGMKLGQMGPSGVSCSKFRKTSSYGGPKVSACALILDAIADKKISAIEGENCVCVKYVDSHGKVYISTASAITGDTDITVKYISDAPSMNWENLIPVFVYETRVKAENEELKELLREIAISSDRNKVLTMCDSFYYGSARRKNVYMYENELAPDVIEASKRTGLFTGNHNILSQFGALPMMLDAETETKKPKIKPDVSTDDEFDDIRSGKRAISFPWTEEQKKRIPSLKSLDDFVPTAAYWKGSRKIKYRTDKVLERLDMGLEGLDALGKDAVNFFMTGKPGTGKTTIAKALAASYGLPFYSIPIQKNTEEGTFQGLLKARDGKFVFTSTDFLDAFKNGGVIVLEEINLADPAVLSGAIGQAIEAPYFVLEDELRPVYRHPLCIIVGTFNVGTAGSKEINPMLSSRFFQTYVVEDPDEKEFVARLMKFDCGKRDAKKIYTAYSRILDYLKSPDVSALEYCKNVTFRGCVGAVQCLQEGAPFKEAIEDTLIGKIAEYDLELAHDVLKNVVETLPD